MKKTLVTITIISLIMFAGIGCNNDKTELAWINDADAPINDIIWADGDEQWSKTDGYDVGQQTESKEVNKLDGTVVASIWEGDDFLEGTVTIAGKGSGSLSLNEGSSEVYTIDSVTPSGL
ncbi:MAG: hypothetical protein WBK20_13995 [Spirochaetota bacterium]